MNKLEINPLVSIITVSFNSEKTIKDTIESVLSQTYEKIEYILIDGASNDKTLEIIKEYEEKFKAKGYEYKYLSEKDNGIYDAMNKGIRISKGEIIGIINSDDWYEEDAVNNIVKEMIKRELDYIYADLRIINDKKERIKKAKYSNWVTTRYWNHPTTFVTRKVYNKYLYRLESIYDDLDLMLRVRKDNTMNVGVLNKIVANFRIGGISTKKSLRKVVQDIKLRNRIYKKNKYSSLYNIENIVMEVAKYILG